MWPNGLGCWHEFKTKHCQLKDLILTLFGLFSDVYTCLRNKSWKLECVLSLNIG